VPTFLLANYKTFAEIQQKSTSSNYRVVNNAKVMEALDKASSIAATRIDHFALHDATGASGVLEFTKAQDGSYSWNVIDTAGVLTNSPDYATQVAYSNEFQTKQNATYGINGAVMTPGKCMMRLTVHVHAHVVTAPSSCRTQCALHASGCEVQHVMRQWTATI
jgi:penicillin V acylase-like amidase (Ntn superfamily)